MGACKLKGVFSYSDINECEVNGGGCTGGCENTVGSFKCTCSEGFQLAGDQVTCVGKCIRIDLNSVIILCLCGSFFSETWQTSMSACKLKTTAVSKLVSMYREVICVTAKVVLRWIPMASIAAVSQTQHLNESFQL